MARRKKTEAEHRREVIAVCRRLAELGLIGGAEGNVSVRLGPERILTTPSGASKVRLTARELLVTDSSGARIAGRAKPSSELAMHLAIYRSRPDVGAVVHAHPPSAVALTLAGFDLSAPLVPEAVTALGGGVPTASYQTPSTCQLAEAVVQTLGRLDACLMERHGAVSVGRGAWEALDRMETVERLAQIVLCARQLGASPAPLPPDEVATLLRLSGR